MILLICGQPGSGKTTIAETIKKNEDNELIILIDGDKWRDLTGNKNYTKEGRAANLTSAFHAALFLEKEGFIPILSFVAPYQQQRQILRDKAETYFEVYLTYEGERGRENYHVPDFEQPDAHIHINTSHISPRDCAMRITEYCNSNE